MSDKKINRDMISEEEYNRAVAGASTDPQDDSPGDSESDAGAEFAAGLNFMPDEKNEYEGAGDDLEKPAFTGKAGSYGKKRLHDDVKIPESAKGINSGQPAPWTDLETNSDVN